MLEEISPTLFPLEEAGLPWLLQLASKAMETNKAANCFLFMD
jgi:hypothetical protein